MTDFSRFKIFLVALVCGAGIFFAFPNLMWKKANEEFPAWWRPVNLGLDLQGGAHILLEVDRDVGLRDHLNAYLPNIRTLLRKNQFGYKGLKIEEDKIIILPRQEDDSLKMAALLSKELTDMEVEHTAQQVTVAMSETLKSELKHGFIRQSIEIVDRRLNEYGTTEPNIQQQGESRILVQLPGEKDPANVKALLGKTAKMTFHLVHPQSHSLVMAGTVPPGYQRVIADDRETDTAYIIEKEPQLSGDTLENAGRDQDQNGRPAVKFKLNSAGAQRFAALTANNIGRQLAIILDNKVISAATIQSAIPAGQGQITGNFSYQQTENLAVLMRAGALPAPLKIVEERTVGADLGADSIYAGQMATVISIIAVGVFMILAYSLFGVFANIALVFNIILLLAAMSVFRFTLTLPGIAGIALTMGMAVDANVLIYERIKEELRKGRRIISAVDTGYRVAMGTILDSNLTTLIGGFLLFVFGTGSIRGFAVTLSLGIVISMFTAITLTRLLAYYWIRWRRPKELAI